MALDLINSTDITQAFSQIFPPELTQSLDVFLNIAKAAGIAILVYIIFLIIQSIVRTRQALRIKSIASDVSEISRKLDILIGKKISKEEKKGKSKDG